MSAILATLAVALSWVILTAALTGLGLGILRLLAGRGVGGAPDDLFWLGWGAFLAGLQLWHFLLPIDGRASAAVLVAGGLCLVCLRPTRRALLTVLFQSSRWQVFVVALLTLWLANLAIAPPLHGDSGLYHFASVRWASEHAIVPGLGNLHGRLAFNSAYFLWVAGLGVGPFAERGFHLANGILILLPLARSVLAAGRIVTGREHRARHLFDALMLFPLAQMAWNVHYLSSPSPDLAVFVLGVVVTSSLVDLVDTSAEIDGRRGAAATVVLVAGCAGVLAKLSFLAFAGAGIAVAAVALRWRSGSPTVRPVAALLWVCATLAPWLARGAILSGYPLYPYPGVSVPVDWAMPRAVVEDEYRWVLSWARQPRTHWSEVLGSWAWLGPWIRSVLSSQHTLVTVVAPLGTAVAAGLASIVLFARRSAGAVRARPLTLAAVPAAASLVYWFFSAPSPRLAGSSFWLLACGLVLAAVVAAGEDNRRRPTVATAAASVALVVAGLGHELWQRGPLVIGAGHDRGFHPPPVPEVERVVLDSGLEIFKPVDGEACWFAPLPCSPYPVPGLRLRRAGNLGSGFSGGRGGGGQR